MSRFSDIRRGGELKVKLDAYVNYLTNPPAPRLNTRGDRDPSNTVYLRPFGTDVGTTEVVSVEANQEGFNRLQAIVNGAGTGAEVIDALGSNDVIDIGRFRAAKVVTFENATKTKTTPNSRFTGRPYLKYAGTTYSCPFGRRAATDDLNDAFRQIKAVLKARTGLQVNRISLTPERIFNA